MTIGRLVCFQIISSNYRMNIVFSEEKIPEVNLVHILVVLY